MKDPLNQSHYANYVDIFGPRQAPAGNMLVIWNFSNSVRCAASGNAPEARVSAEVLRSLY